ncbi:hypothetical protein DFH08DRAFT_856860 [Mycena albidolilacea]|uniref:Uncharacterized protein n=1 Tax=Mycena albidolilacea TaxID=1033008 RepID=A0AAD7AAJ3_9AGAR|nr:hypothetical protein DFH08DRAFT_856860 [Mycena albidolilacea]
MSSAPLSETDELTLKSYGLNIMLRTLRVVAESIFFSAYGILFALAVYSILRKGLRSRGPIIMLVLVVYFYATCATQWALNFSDAFKNVHHLLMDLDTPIQDRLDLENKSRAPGSAAQEALWVSNMILGDSVVIWRTWAIYQRRILAISVPCVLLFTSFVFVLMDVVCNISELNSPFPGSHKICPAADIVGWAFSVATNIACTVLIGFKAWQHRKRMRDSNMPQMPTEKILSLLVESGFIYSLLWLSQVIAYTGFSTVSPWHWVYEVLDPMGNQIAGMYPTLIIVIVNFKRTAWEEASSHSHSGTSSNPRFKRSGPAERFSYHRHGGVSIQLETVIEMDNIVKSNDKEPTHL